MDVICIWQQEGFVLYVNFMCMATWKLNVWYECYDNVKVHYVWNDAICITTGELYIIYEMNSVYIRVECKMNVLFMTTWLFNVWNGYLLDN